MKKSIIKLALDSLELRLMQDRQEAKRKSEFPINEDPLINIINEKLELVRNHQKELEIVINHIDLY